MKHTHNDTLDLLLIGGVAGIAWLLSFIWAWGSSIARFGPWSLEGAATVAIFIDYLCHAQLTGQLWGTDVMNYYVTALTAFTVLGLRSRVSPRAQHTTALTAPVTATGPLLGEKVHA